MFVYGCLESYETTVVEWSMHLGVLTGRMPLLILSVPILFAHFVKFNKNLSITDAFKN